MTLDFYYFSYQCPLNDNMVRLLDAYRDRLEIHLHDVSGDRATAERQKLFFPTLTVLNGEKRYYAPLSRSFLEQAAAGRYPKETPYRPALSDRAAEDTILPLTLDTVHMACACCGSRTAENCRKKKEFLRRLPQNIYGFLHTNRSGGLLGGAEFLPSEAVPYPVPHDAATAFLTCLYLSDPEYDYKSAPLSALEAYLKHRYARLIAISDETGVFPNGDLPFFLRNGYRDEGVVFEDPHYCRLHLVSKDL